MTTGITVHVQVVQIQRMLPSRNLYMCLEIQVGETSSREKPDDMPERAVNYITSCLSKMQDCDHN